MCVKLLGDLNLKSSQSSRHLRRCFVPFNRALIRATWFIHAATGDITTLINHAVRHSGRPQAHWARLTNLHAIFHLNNLALPQGSPVPDTHTAHCIGGLLHVSGFPSSGHSKGLFDLPFLAQEKHCAAQSTARGCLPTTTLAILD